MSSVLLSGNRLQSEPGLQDRHWFWWDIVLPFALTRILLTIIGFAAVNTMLLSQYEPMSQTTVRHGWINTWARWDATWYLGIARDGYSYAPGHQSNVAFFPLYPLLMKLGGYILGHNDTGWLTSGILLSNAFLLVAMTYLWRLVRLDFDTATARRAVLYAVVAPTTLFLSAVYPMSLILAIALAAFYYARQQAWWTSALIAALAPLARPDGVLLVPGLLFEYLRQRHFQLRQVRADAAALIFLPAMALGLWMCYLRFRFGDALAFVHTQSAWPSYSLRTAMEDWDVLAGGAAAAFCAVLLIVAAFHVRVGYVIAAGLYWVLMISVSRFPSVPRFALVLFPAYIALAVLGRNARVHTLWLITSAGLATVILLRFSLCYFEG